MSQKVKECIAYDATVDNGKEVDGKWHWEMGNKSDRMSPKVFKLPLENYMCPVMLWQKCIDVGRFIRTSARFDSVQSDVGCKTA